MYFATLLRWLGRDRTDMARDEIRNLMTPPPGWSIDASDATPEVLAVFRELGLPLLGVDGRA
jgi:hypothetical protein